MPFTPLHLGAGAAFKAVGGRQVSFMVFGGAQVLMDIEPGVRMLAGTALLHGWTHTLGGALVIGTLATLLGRPVSNFVLTRLGRPFQPVSWRASAWGAYLGTFSHVLLDALMHDDMRPFAPFTDNNPLLFRIGLDTLHQACLVSGLVFGFIVLARYWASHRRRSL